MENISRTESASSNGYNYYNRTFDDIIDLFIYACTHGDYMMVYSLLNARKVKADVYNRMGKSALQLAIENEHFEVVKVLLDTIPYEQFRDALLLAIYLGHTNIADFILNHPTYRTFEGGFLDPKHPQAYDDSQFSSDITPLILAAQHNRLLIVHQLLLKGERIKKPHQTMCTCIDCVENSALDSFRQAQIRLSAYKGLSSEIYIALAYPDPILQAFELSYELRNLAKVEHYFCEEYKKLANQLSIFVARLLDYVRGHEELEIVLNKTGRPNEERYEILSRFDLAIQHREKPFVSHSNCQQKLIGEWYAHLSAIKNTHLFQRTIFYLGYIICFPFLVLAYYISPKSRIGSLCQQPNLKFKAYVASYFIFIGLIITMSSFSGAYLENTQFLSTYNSTIYRNYIQLIYRNSELKNGIIGISGNETNTSIASFVNCDISLRFTEPNPFQIAIFIWIIGFLWNQSKQIVRLGLVIYSKTPSNYVDCSMNILYILYFIFLYTSMIFTRLSINTFHSNDYWTHLARYETLSDSDKQYYISKTRHILYWLNADRFYWKNGDLHNLAEAFFAMGNVVSFCRICFLLPVIAFVGPLQVMLDRLMIDIAKWIFIIIIFFFAFSCSLYFIFSYFAAVLQQEEALGHLSAPSISITNQSSIVLNNGNCPDYFYQLLNETISVIVDVTSSTTTDDSNLDSCQQSSHYSTYERVGHYPAIYYFGESFGTTLLTTFFTLFNVIGTNEMPDRTYELITLSCYKPDPSTYLPGFDTFVSNLGFIIYGLFTFICVTVLINTLIAMLEETIEEVDDRADIEWKFARSKLYMEYIRNGDSLPVPMNLFPSPTSIVKTFQWLKRMVFRTKSLSEDESRNLKELFQDNPLHINMGRIVNTANKPNTEPGVLKNGNASIRKRSSIVSNEKLTYKMVIERIVKRFLLYYQHSHHGSDQAKEDSEFREVKYDISSFRFEIAFQIDQLDQTGASLIQSMNQFNDNLEEHFDIVQIKQYLDQRTTSPEQI